MSVTANDEVNTKRSITEHVETVIKSSDDTTTPWKALREGWPSVLCCIFATIGPLMYGFDMVVVGACISMPAFQMDFGTPFHQIFLIPALWQSLWNSLVQLGVIAGAVINSPFQDRFGRKWAFRTGAMIGVVGIALLYVSNMPESVTDRRVLFLVGKIILGVALGQLLSTCQTYVSEVAPPALRGPLLSIYTFSMVVGQLIAIGAVNARILIFSPAAYKVILGSQWAWCGALFVGSFLIPESPYHLISHGRDDEARVVIAKSHSKALDSNLRYESIKQTLEHEKSFALNSSKATLRECFQGSNRRRTMILSLTVWMQQFLGVTLLANGTYFLQMAGMNVVKSIQISMIGISLALPATVISWYTMVRFGRRFILLISFVTVGTLWLSIGVAGFYPSSGTALLYMGIMIQIVTFFYGLGGGSVIFVIAAEVSSARLRGKSQVVAFINSAFSSWLFNFTVPYMFNADEGDLGGKCGLIFGALCVLGLGLSWLYIPETKGRTFAEIDEMFEKNLPTRAFRNHICEIHSADNKTHVREV